MRERAAFRQTTTDADRIGFFGKLPSHGDFVSSGLARGLQDLIDIWLQSGLQRLQHVFPNDWEARFKTMPPWRFVIHRGHWGPATLAGVILPSVDRVGRSFPLVIIANIPGFTGDPRCVCLDDSWFTAAEGIAETSTLRDFDVKTFTAGLKRLRSPNPGDLDPKRGAPVVGTLWWRRGDDRRLIEVRNAGAPQPEDLLKLIKDGRTVPRPSAMPVLPIAAAAVADGPRTLETVAARTPAHKPPIPKPQTLFRLNYTHVSHPGTRLSVNADSVLTSAERGLFALADGIGDGNMAGEAARIANAALDEVNPQETMEEVVQAVKGKLGRAHGLIQAAKASFGREPPGASIAVLAFHAQNVALIWAGDVRCYIIRDGMMRCLTRDHIEIGLKRGLSRYLGRAGQFSPELGLESLNTGDRLLLCSNPLCRVLPERSIAEILISKKLDEATAILGQEALIAGCRDNFSAIVIDVSANHG